MRFLPSAEIFFNSFSFLFFLLRDHRRKELPGVLFRCNLVIELCLLDSTKNVLESWPGRETQGNQVMAGEKPLRMKCFQGQLFKLAAAVVVIVKHAVTSQAVQPMELQMK